MIDAGKLAALTSLQLTGSFMNAQLVLPPSLRHLALPDDEFGSLGRWLGPMQGGRPRSLHVDSVTDSPPGEVEGDEPLPSVGLMLAAAAQHLPQLKALSVNLEKADPLGHIIGAEFLLDDLPTALRALAVIRLPRMEQTVLSGLRKLTRLWFSFAPGKSARLPRELARLSRLRELTVVGSKRLKTLAPLKPLRQLSSLALLACRLKRPAMNELANLTMLQASREAWRA